MGLYQYEIRDSQKTARIDRLITNLFKEMPQIESARARLLTESYRATEALPTVIRRAKAFAHILENIPIIIRDEELIVGSTTIAPRGCQTYPEFSFAWLEAEFETVAARSADPFYISETAKAELKAAHRYWPGKTTSELATAYMAPETLLAMEHHVFTPGNYFYNGVGHISVQYDKVLASGYGGIQREAESELAGCRPGDADYAAKSRFLQAVILSCKAAVAYAHRYAELAAREAARCQDPRRQAELVQIAANCRHVPENGAANFYEACQAFWFVQQLIQIESSGHSISPGRFDQYMYPYYEADIRKRTLTKEFAQELIDCIWVKLNDLNKCRDADSAEGFSGYSLFQNLIAGGQDQEGRDVTNDLSFMVLQASVHVQLPQPSLSVRVWNGSPHEFLIKAAELTRTGVGMPAYYNDEVVIPSLLNRGLSLADARDYGIIGCVEPQKAGKTEGWHDAAFFNMCRPLELVFSAGRDRGVQIGARTPPVEAMTTFEEFYDAYKAQMNYMIELLVNADNAIDMAHAKRCPLPFLSSMVEDCLGRGKTVQEGGAVYNFTGPQGFGVANMADSLYAIKQLVFEQHRVTLKEYKEALMMNFGQGLTADQIAGLAADIALALKKNLPPTRETGKREADTAEAMTTNISMANTSAAEISAENTSTEKTSTENTSTEKISMAETSAAEVAAIIRTIIETAALPSVKEQGGRLLKMIEEIPKFGNDIPEVDAFARDVAYTYTRPLERYRNPRGGIFQAGLYPVSANVPLGAKTGATPDGRLAGTPVADGVSPSAGKDQNGPTAAANSVARLDHYIASNGTLFNQKFHPSALSGREGLEKFVALVRSYFDQKGSHMQFNVVSRETLLDAQRHPEQYQQLVVRVAGYSALFTTLSRSLQDDIINRTEQGL